MQTAAKAKLQLHREDGIRLVEKAWPRAWRLDSVPEAIRLTMQYPFDFYISFHYPDCYCFKKKKKLFTYEQLGWLVDVGSRGAKMGAVP